MPDLRELYRSVILDHNKKPRNLGEPEGANRSADGFNPLCGDKVTVYLTVEEGTVKDAGFTGSGCAISMAAASLMTESIKGKPLGEVERLFDGFCELVTADPTTEVDSRGLGELVAFTGVREFSMRVRCATLPWHAMRAALQQSGETATTE